MPGCALQNPGRFAWFSRAPAHVVVADYFPPLVRSWLPPTLPFARSGPYSRRYAAGAACTGRNVIEIGALRQPCIKEYESETKLWSGVC